jgi:DNA damage-binding protein 1
VSWDLRTRQLRTERSYLDLADKSSRDSQTGNRCLVDPSGKFITLEVYEGVVTVVPIVQIPSKQRKRPIASATAAAAAAANAPRVGELAEPCFARIDELVVRSSAFLYCQAKRPPRLALLYEDPQRKVRLKVRELMVTPGGLGGEGAVADLNEVDVLREELEFGANHLIPVPAPLGMFFCVFFDCPSAFRGPGGGAVCGLTRVLAYVG